MSNWIQVYRTPRESGAIWPLSPKREHIDLRSIAHALSLKCRFNGHCLQFYSIAQHSLLVLDILDQLSPGLPAKERACALLHDAAEAYLPDIPRPIKPELIGFISIEARMQRAIWERFGLLQAARRVLGLIELADDIALATERRDVMGPPPPNMKRAVWERFGLVRLLPSPIDDHIVPMPDWVAKDAFLVQADQLGLLPS